MSDQAFVKGLILVLLPIVCGVIFQAGRLAERVDNQRRELESMAKEVRDGFRTIADLIRGDGD